MATITSQGVYARLKKLIACLKNVETRDVLAHHTLRGDLRFTEAGARALATRINEEFADLGVRMTPDEVAEAKTVQDLSRSIWKKATTQQEKELCKDN